MGELTVSRSLQVDAEVEQELMDWADEIENHIIKVNLFGSCVALQVCVSSASVGCLNPLAVKP